MCAGSATATSRSPSTTRATARRRPPRRTPACAWPGVSARGHAETSHRKSRPANVPARPTTRWCCSTRSRRRTRGRPRTLLGDLGYDPTYGARPLKRVIQKRLVHQLPFGILEGGLREGDMVVVDAADGELTFAKAESPMLAV
ncbi:MAG TPA: hypothetical protein VK501_15360 [Baekduia sp.]|uniref:hypothetical protein n=1 Tax=Baekduia sp. TaxID=2600305 RepID=UPI002D0BC7A5|nr:hypothetical protein [Baekduia sp.]HMJ35287.1 hypothetical protein [Baekduia sp.]